MNYVEELKKYLELEVKVIQNLDLEEINAVMNVLEEARLAGKRIFICGNGGSAATASHFTGDFNKGLNEVLDVKYNFECLSDNVAGMMAIANDYSEYYILRISRSRYSDKHIILMNFISCRMNKNLIIAIVICYCHHSCNIIT